MGPQLEGEAPGFHLYNQDKKEVSLQEQRGRNVVLLFFPLAFTSTCTAELCHIRDEHARYNDLDATVFGLSIDSLYALKKFREEQRLNFDLLSDFNREASRSYDCLYPTFSNGMREVSKRAAFVIDKKGILRHAEVLENASLQPDYQKIISCLESLR
jgi:glutaredoxin-dependent peroxiredoxin